LVDTMTEGAHCGGGVDRTSLTDDAGLTDRVVGSDVKVVAAEQPTSIKTTNTGPNQPWRPFINALALNDDGRSINSQSDCCCLCRRCSNRLRSRQPRGKCRPDRYMYLPHCTPSLSGLARMKCSLLTLRQQPRIPIHTSEGDTGPWPR